MKIQNIEMRKIVPDPEQPRKFFGPAKLATLVRSIKKHGVMNAVTVEEDNEGNFVLLDGERRYRASQELGLKEIPANVVKTGSKTDRLIQQFHLQEQHEGWTAAEKAMAIMKLSEDMEISVAEIAILLGVAERTMSTYISFSKIINKELFNKRNIGLKWAERIAGLKAIVKKSFAERNIPYTRDVEKKIEEGVVARIVSGMMAEEDRSVSKLKDAFKADPKSIEKFLTDKNVSPEDLFISTKARGAYHFRQVWNHTGYLTTHVRRLIEDGSVKLDEKMISRLKISKKAIEEILSHAE